MGKSKTKPKAKSKRIDDDELLEEAAAEEIDAAEDFEAEEVAIDDEEIALDEDFEAEEAEETEEVSADDEELALDEDLDAEEADETEEVAADDEENALDEDFEAEESAAEEDADAEEPATDEDAYADRDLATGVTGSKGSAANGGGAADDEEADVDIATGPLPPKAKLTKTALALLVLNWVAVPAFLYAAYMDHLARVSFSHHAYINHVQIWGLPLREEDDNASLSSEVRQRIRLTPEQLKTTFNTRRGVTKLGGNEQFQAIEESVPVRIRPRDMTDMVLADVYWDLRDRVPTLEDEIERLQKALPTAIDKAADEVLQSLKTDEEKRALIQKTLFAIAWDVWQVEKLDKALIQAKGADLDALVKESVERRLYYDILAPINIFRPGDLKKFSIERISDLDVPLDDVKSYLKERFEGTIAKEYDFAVHIGEDWMKVNNPPEAAEDGIPAGSMVSEWGGSQTLENYGRVSFQFLAGGDAAVGDRDGAVGGTWKRAGNNVELSFRKKDITMTYKGAINGTSMQGNASNNKGQQWQWEAQQLSKWGPEILKQRTSTDKRQTIGFILFALSQVQVPALDKKNERKLIDKGIERAQTVSGVYEFTDASIQYVRTLRILEQRVVEAVTADRDGYILTVEGKMTRTKGNTDLHREEIDRLIKIVAHIDAADKRLKDLLKQRDEFKTVDAQRTAQLKDATDKLFKARKSTEKYVQELRVLQNQLHEALIELSDAADRNLQLFEDIVNTEKKLSPPPPKGGKKRP